MAQYHLTIKNISRATNGRRKSSVASAAYRAGEKLKDEQSGRWYNYGNRSGVVHNEITAPDNSPEWVKDRSTLWNKIEQRETRKNSRLAKEVEISLPRELSQKDNITLVRKFAEFLSSQGDIVVDWSLHNDKNNHNPHAHLLLATRKIENNEFTEKVREHGHKNFLQLVRKKWADLHNAFTGGLGIKPIDHRSYKEQGINLIPTIAEGRRTGNPTTSKRIDERIKRNDQAKAINHRRAKKSRDRRRSMERNLSR